MPNIIEIMIQTKDNLNQFFGIHMKSYELSTKFKNNFK